MVDTGPTAVGHHTVHAAGTIKGPGVEEDEFHIHSHIQSFMLIAQSKKCVLRRFEQSTNV
jgi:hypothetical protein